MLKKLCLFAFVIGGLSVAGQEQAIADSLKEVYAQETLTDTTEMLVLFDIAFNETDLEEAERYSDSLIAKAKAANNLLFEYRGYLQKGYAKQYQGVYDLAFDAFFKALDGAMKAQYDPGVGASYTAIADAYSLSGDSENANRYYTKAIGVLRSIPDSLTLATTLLNAGDEYFKSDQLDSALAYFEESGTIFDQLDYEIGQAYNLGNVGLVLAKQGAYDLAEERLEAASVILERLGDLYPIAEYNFYISDIYKERNELDRAISRAQFGYNIARYHGFKKEIKDGAERLSVLFELNNDLRKSLDYLRETRALEDSLNTTDVIREMAEQQRAFDVAQKQIEVDLLNQQQRTQRIIGLALIIILVLSGIVVVVLYKTSVRRKKLNSELALINETKDKLFSIISHDLRGPISAFYGINTIIKHLIKKKRYADLEDMTNEIDQSVQSIAALLDNLLKWAVQQQGKFSYHPEPLGLYRLIEDNRNLLAPVADAKTIDLINKVSKDVTIWADKNSVMTIFRNIMSNAIKFTREQGSVEVRSEIRDDQVIVTVIDSGIGMSEEQLKALFEFKNPKSSYGTSGEKGVGLGIQLAYEFTSLNKGAIEVQSEVDVGTSVHITLPLVTQPADSVV